MAMIIWLGIMAALLVIEAMTVQLLTVWFAAGALAAAIASYFGAGVAVQLLVFFAVSVVLLYFTRPLAMKHAVSTPEKTNADSLVGRNAVVVQKIDNLAQTGQVRINDVEWIARSAAEEKTFESGGIVRIERIEGVKLIVDESKEE